MKASENKLQYCPWATLKKKMKPVAIKVIKYYKPRS